MLHPSYSELMTKINNQAEGEEPVVKSRYTIVMGTAKRARQMVDNGYMEEEDHSRKPLSIAVEELDEGKIRILTDAEREKMEAEFAAKHAAQEEAPEAEAQPEEEQPAEELPAEEKTEEPAEEN